MWRRSTTFTADSRDSNTGPQQRRRVVLVAILTAAALTGESHRQALSTLVVSLGWMHAPLPDPLVEQPTTSQPAADSRQGLAATAANVWAGPGVGCGAPIVHIKPNPLLPAQRDAPSFLPPACSACGKRSTNKNPRNLSAPFPGSGGTWPRSAKPTPSTASAAPLSGQEGALTWNGGAADDLARQHGCRPGSVARCVGGRTECSSASTQDRLIALIRLDPLPRSPTCPPSNPPWLD